MATVIRLARFGTKHAPKYRVTVADSRKYVTGKFIEVLGTYNPVPRGQEKKIDVDVEKLQDWIKKGAQPSDRVKYLIRQIEKSK
jgi:small subunit ribosomal protein S16